MAGLTPTRITPEEPACRAIITDRLECAGTARIGPAFCDRIRSSAGLFQAAGGNVQPGRMQIINGASSSGACFVLIARTTSRPCTAGQPLPAKPYW